MFYSNIIIARVIVVHLDYPKKIRKQLRLFPFTIHNFTTPNLLDVNNFSLHPVVQALQVLSNWQGKFFIDRMQIFWQQTLHLGSRWRNS